MTRIEPVKKRNRGNMGTACKRYPHSYREGNRGRPLAPQQLLLRARMLGFAGLHQQYIRGLESDGRSQGGYRVSDANPGVLTPHGAKTRRQRRRASKIARAARRRNRV